MQLNSQLHLQVRISCSESRLLRGVKDNVLGLLKNQLRAHLSGIMSSSVRQDMITEILYSGQYPSAKFHNQMCEAHFVHFDSEADKNVFEEMKKHGSVCCSICCTGAFIVETMLSVIINEDVKEIKFDTGMFTSLSEKTFFQCTAPS